MCLWSHRIAVILAVTLVGAPALADEAQAAKTFAEGERAFSAGAYRRAAVLFEEAYGAAAHPATLFNAAKARAQAGDHALAANHYARLDSDASPPADRADARSALAALQPKVGYLQVRGDFDSSAVDGVPLGPSGRIYVEPGEHLITGQRRDTKLKKTARVAAGQSVTVDLIAEVATKEAPPSPPRSSGLPRVVTYILGGATIVSGGVTTWSGLDTLAKKDEFDPVYANGRATDANARLDDGLAAQTRTNVLLGVTVGLAVLTGVAVLLTDWRRSSAASFRAARHEDLPLAPLDF